MELKHLRPIFYLAVVFLSLGYFTSPTAAQTFHYTKIEMSYREAPVARGDGIVLTAYILEE